MNGISKGLGVIASVLILASGAPAQDRSRRITLPSGVTFVPPAPTPYDTLVSPEVAVDRRATFRIYAPAAKKVDVSGEFLPLGTLKLPLVRQANGVWSVTTNPLPTGAYRYNFVVDDAIVVDSRNLSTSKSATQVRSMLVVSDGDFASDRSGVLHGAVAETFYASPRLGIERRMHIYTPPGYGKDGRSYPVLYLLHGGGDSDDSWPTVGRAGMILDNLIAEGKAVPMIVVMPNGSVRPTGQPMTWDSAKDPFTADLRTAVMPYIEANYRVSAKPEDTALAGLSMGGLQALNIGLTETARFRWVGVFSSGWFPTDLAAFEARYGGDLKVQTERLRLLYYTNGSDDIALPQALKVQAMFDRRGVKYESHVTPGGHTWDNWRLNLSNFAPLLFKPVR